MTRWFVLLGAILSEVSASLSLKAALDRPWLYAIVIGGYVTSFALLSLVLRRGMALGVAYGIWAAVGVALTAIMSALIYDEPLNATMGVGIALVVVGVLAVELGAKTPSSDATTVAASGQDEEVPL